MTTADQIAATAAKVLCHQLHSMDGRLMCGACMAKARMVLAAVTPLIEAKALRDAAEDIRAETGVPGVKLLPNQANQASGIYYQLVTRADNIEKGEQP